MNLFEPRQLAEGFRASVIVSPIFTSAALLMFAVM
jgi:hypothetical protein